LAFLKGCERSGCPAGGFGVVKLLEDRSTGDLIAVRLFDSAVSQAPDESGAFSHKIDALVLLVHLWVVRIFGCRLATRTSQAQIRTEFAAGGSLREALQRLDDTGKAIVVMGLVIGMRFVHSRGVIHRDLKPANIPLTSGAIRRLVTSGTAASGT
jgi:serine/threonine protein kinase